MSFEHHQKPVGRAVYHQHLHFLVVICLIQLIFQSLSVKADGFGWYVIRFDYQQFNQDFDNERVALFLAIEQSATSEQTLIRDNDGAIVEWLLEPENHYSATPPISYDGELLDHQTLMYWARKIDAKQSPIKNLFTGRVYHSKDKVSHCSDSGQLIYGYCRTFVLFTNEETNTVFQQLTTFITANPLLIRDRENWKNVELFRLYQIFKEATLMNQGLYFYGHD